MTTKIKRHFFIGTRWFGVLGPCELMIDLLADEGYEVFVFGQQDRHYLRYDRKKARLVKIHMKRSYISYFHDLLDIIKLIYFVIRYRPEGIHSFNPKPALLSWIASLVRPNTKFFIGVTGLGNTFIRAKRMEGIIRWLLRNACRRASFVFFQNFDDIAMFQERSIVAKEKCRLFIGPGVDLRHFKPNIFLQKNKFEHSNQIIVICVARLIWQKGIREFVEAARRLKDTEGPISYHFKLVGEIDDNHPDCVDSAFIKAAVNDNIIHHISWTDNVAIELSDADIFVLHSYREGAPRAILEASAMCLPTVGSDAVGVRELVVNGKTGFLTPLHDVQCMVESIQKLAYDSDLRRRMGNEARKTIAEPYSLTNSSNAQLQMYRDVGYKLPTLTPVSGEKIDLSTAYV